MSEKNKAIRDRIEKALKQRMYLINASMISENNWKFIVEGSTGIHYDVLINNKLSCSCKDFTTRHLICKHIYFIIVRVLKNSDLIELVNGQGPNICIFSLKLNLNENFNKILNPRFKNNKETFNVMDIMDVCSICYENYVKEDVLVKCGLCNNYFHDECISRWLKSATKCTCPLCREMWISNDELCKFAGLT